MNSSSYTSYKQEIENVDLCSFVADYVPVRRVSKGVMITCPWHDDHDPSMYVTHDSAFCFACGKSANKRLVVNYFTGDTPVEYIKYAKPAPPSMKELKVEESFVNAAHKLLLNTPSKLEYLTEERGLCLDIIKEYKIGYITPPFRKYQRPRYCFPSWDFNGKLRTVGYRQDPSIKYANEYPENKKYVIHSGTHSMLYNAHKVKDYPYIIHVGGQFDALSLLQNGIYATGAMGEGAFQEPWAKHFIGKPTYILMDNDDAGIKSALRTQVMIPHATIINWNDRTPPKFDVNDLVAKQIEANRAGIEPSLGTLRAIHARECAVRS